MNIIKAMNTPTLLKEIIGDDIFSENSTGSAVNQTFTIDSDTSNYINNSVITITNISNVTYSALGLITPPATSTTSSEDSSNDLFLSNNDNFLNNSLNSSFLGANPNLKSLCNEVLSYIDKSLKSTNYISKETYLLLSIQSLVDFLVLLSTTFLKNDTLDVINFITESLLSASNSIKLMSKLIGTSDFSYNYASKISRELDSSCDLFKTSLKLVSITNTKYKYIQEFLKSYKDFDIKDTNSETLFVAFYEYLSKYYIFMESFLNLLSELPMHSSHLSLLNIINSLQIINKTINSASITVFLSYSDIKTNYDNIVEQINSACNNGNSMYLINDNVNLYNTFNYNVVVNKSFSTKQIDNAPIQKTSKYDALNTTVSSTNKLETIVFTMNFYVSNLKINFSGTIGNIPFTGYIFFPSTFNLSYFGINTLTVSTIITVPSNINTFNVTECLNPDLKINSIVPSLPYSTSTPESFTGSVNLSLIVNGEIIATTLSHIIITK